MTRHKTPYIVNYWGSHPEAGNDDCWTGEDYATLAEAETAYACEGPCYPDGTPIGWAYVEIVGPGVDKVRHNPSHDAARDRREVAAYDRAWRREQAYQAGMAFGCDGYNDAMGY